MGLTPSAGRPLRGPVGIGAGALLAACAVGLAHGADASAALPVGPPWQHGAPSADASAPEGAVRTARLRAELTGPPEEGVPVELVYRLRVPEGAGDVPLSVLEVDGGGLEGVRYRVGGGAFHPLSWDGGEGPASRGRVALDPGQAGSDSLGFELRYTVRAGAEGEGGERRVRLPVIQVAWPPSEALPGTFVARAALPDTLHVTGTFPTVLGEVREGAGTERWYVFDLQVVPGLVVLETTGGGAPLLTFARTLDLVVLAILSVLAVAGFRALRRGAA